ncbi:MAG: hypothetical protein QOJ15_6283 [Bradyrhizobium sp.]|nr:hypothetical protein [Bradyrhizobium sp.]
MARTTLTEPELRELDARWNAAAILAAAYITMRPSSVSDTPEKVVGVFTRMLGELHDPNN